ncbi:MAG: glycosyltransferase family 2 protein [Armatimonadota bacterium]
MKSTVIIVNHNGHDLLARSVPAAFEAVSRNVGHRIVVADDGSADQSIEFLCKSFPEAQVMALPRRGFGPTCNAAVEAAETDAVVLLNNDVVVTPGFLDPLLDRLAEPGVFAVGCKFLNADGSLTDSLGNRTAGRWQSGLLRLQHETREDRLGRTCPQLYANGGGMAFWRDKWLALGGFDQLYHPFYWEDVDIGYRAWGRGWRVLYEPASIVFHDQGSTMRRVHQRAYVELISARNAVLFSWKNLLDPRLFRRALAAQARWVGDDVLIGGLPSRTTALWHAWRQLRRAARARAAEQRVRLRTDAEILALSSEGAL